jgi:hypothetical protein
MVTWAFAFVVKKVKVAKQIRRNLFILVFVQT